MEYRVSCLAVNGKGNRIYRPRDGKIDGSKFIDPEKLVELGKLSRVGGDEVPEENPVERIEQQEEVDSKLKSYDDITVKELRGLTGVSDPTKRKADLYEIYSKLS